MRMFFGRVETAPLLQPLQCACCQFRASTEIGATDAARETGVDLDDAAPIGAYASGNLEAGWAEAGGTGAPTSAVSRSGIQGVDGLLVGTRWSGGRLTYSDPDSPGDYQPGYFSDADYDGISAQNEGFSRLNNAQQLAMHAILNAQASAHGVGGVTVAAARAAFSVEGLTNLGVDYAGAGSGAGTLRLANSSDPRTAYAYYPGTTFYAGDSFYGPNYDTRNATIGSYGYIGVIHELGHNLGLKHGHETGGFGAMPSAVDSMEYSVMTYRSYVGAPTNVWYNESYGFAQTFMMYDIRALQHMYGADYSTNSGDTVYKWSPGAGATSINGSVAIAPGGNRIFLTIWDGGGKDTYDLSAYTTDLEIDLRPGGHSVFSQSQLAYLGGGPNGGYARGNVFNALQVGGDTRSLIENAVGGAGDDYILGNDAANLLAGGSGDDELYGLNGNDTLKGLDGDDYIAGGGGADKIEGGKGDDYLFGDTGNDTLQGGFGEDSMEGGAGDDTFLFSGGSTATAVVEDTIFGFQGAGVAGGDVIDLSLIDADLTAGGNQAFKFGGTGKGFISLINQGSDTLLRANLDNDSAFEYLLLIADGSSVVASNYKASDFVL